jgi:4-methyl-5(b-hydroxyethyl)-thiazole monophosphate biosynthesis
MAKYVLVAIADGTEEIEAVTVIDVLRRAGVTVSVASVSGMTVNAAHDIRIIADRHISECADETYDMIVLPGGMPGAVNLRESGDLSRILARHDREGKYIAAICASPAVVLQDIGLLAGRQATCYPSFAEQLENTEKSGEPVVTDGTIITSQGPGTALLFAFTLVQVLCGKDAAVQLAGAMLFPLS